MRFRWHIVILASLLPNLQCGRNSLAACKGTLAEELKQKNCVKKSPDERAVLAFNEGDYALAQSLLEELIAAEPDQFFRYPRLAAVYSVQGGFDLFDLANIKGGGDSNGGFFGSVSEFLPTPDPENLPDFKDKVTKIGQAVHLLEAIPADNRTVGSTFYAASASLQLTLYQTAYSIMYLNQFAVPVTAGSTQIDPERLSSLTIEDAKIILNNLGAAAKNAETTDPATAAKITGIVAAINSQDGGDSRQNLIAFMQSQQKT